MALSFSNSFYAEAQEIMRGALNRGLAKRHFQNVDAANFKKGVRVFTEEHKRKLRISKRKAFLARKAAKNFPQAGASPDRSNTGAVGRIVSPNV